MIDGIAVIESSGTFYNRLLYYIDSDGCCSNPTLHREVFSVELPSINASVPVSTTPMLNVIG